MNTPHKSIHDDHQSNTINPDYFDRIDEAREILQFVQACCEGSGDKSIIDVQPNGLYYFLDTILTKLDYSKI